MTENCYALSVCQKESLTATQLIANDIKRYKVILNFAKIRSIDHCAICRQSFDDKTQVTLFKDPNV